MKKLIISTILVILTTSAHADMIRFRTTNFVGKATAEQIELTDWQSVMICHYNLGNKTQEVMKYPSTFFKKTLGDENSYSIQIKSMSLTELLPNIDIINCAYKLILIGKNTINRQNVFGEVYLFGTEQRKMTDKEIELINNKELLSKMIESRLKDLVLTIGNDGGIIAKNLENE